MSAPKNLRPNRMKAAEFVRKVYHAEPSIDDTKEDILRPEYWLHMAPNMKPGDKIEMLWENGEQYAEALVLSATGKGASIGFTLEPMKLAIPEMPKTGSSLYDVKWAGRHAKHRIIRLSDNEIMRSGFDSAPDAWRYVAKELKAA